eukprot:TRINITY_DN37265_c0_g2_i1.p1 TRINITY_DN37265_c0_g2~~TRINITY_DN37265_c0_g2_i1.p1  ORF type:complete len:465 (-),score=73.09 TRINITY_DN37265_c0_g2_i1:121-1392(-)
MAATAASFQTFAPFHSGPAFAEFNAVADSTTVVTAVAAATTPAASSSYNFESRSGPTVACPPSSHGISGGGRGGNSLTRCIIRDFEEGCCSHAVLFNQDVGEGRRVEALLQILAEICIRDPEAQCLLICERRQLHGTNFLSPGRTSCLPEAGSAEVEALRRVHVKYVTPAAAATTHSSGVGGVGGLSGGALPPIASLLTSIHCLTFAPTVVAVLGLMDLVASGGRSSSHGAAFGSSVGRSSGSNGYFPWALNGGFALADGQHFALALGLLSDATAQLITLRRRPCAAFVWEDAQSLNMSQRALLGISCEAVWLAESSDTAAPRGCTTLIATPFFAVDGASHLFDSDSDEEMPKGMSPICGGLPQTSPEAAVAGTAASATTPSMPAAAAATSPALAAVASTEPAAAVAEPPSPESSQGPLWSCM